MNGLKAAGPNFTRQYSSTDQQDDRLQGRRHPLNGVDWTKQHTQNEDPNLACEFKSTIKNATFDPNYSEPDKPWHCVTADPATGTADRRQPGLTRDPFHQPGPA